MTAEYWPWFAGGAALAVTAIGHWLLLGRTLAVSGRMTAIVDRLRFGAAQEPAMSPEELMAAMRAATAEAFGEDSVPDAPAADAAPEPPPTLPRQPWWVQATFLGCVVLGGFLASAMAGTFSITSGLRGELFARTFGTDPLVVPLVLIGGGILIGFGTRMAGGCTSGHGLCGVSRGQPGSLLATAAFFGMAIVMSVALEAMW